MNTYKTFTSTPDMFFQMYFDNLERFKYRLPNDEELRSIDMRRRRIEQAGGGGINRFEDWFLRSAAPERIRCYHEGSVEYNILSEKLAKDLL